MSWQAIGRFAIVWLYSKGTNTTGGSGGFSASVSDSLVSVETFATVAARIDKLWLCFSRIFSDTPPSPDILRLCLSAALDDIVLWFVSETVRMATQLFSWVYDTLSSEIMDMSPTVAIGIVAVSSLCSFYAGLIAARQPDIPPPPTDAIDSIIELPDHNVLTVPISFYAE